METVDKKISEGGIYFINIYSIQSIGNMDNDYDDKNATLSFVTGEKIVMSDWNNGDVEFVEGYERNYDAYAEFSGELPHMDLDTNYDMLYKPEASKYGYAGYMRNFMQELKKYPLGMELDCIFPITEDSKEIYLHHTDEERKKVMQEIKANALLDFEETNKFVSEVIEEMLTEMENVTEEDYAMADLENKLYDFEHKGRTK